LGERGQLEVTNTLADLERVAREFRDKKIQTLAINGGDGTICRTLTAFIKVYGDEPLPRVALLRGGTINMLAGNLGIRGTPEQVLYRLVESHSSGIDLPTTRYSTLKIEDNFGFLFGNGTGATFLKEYYKRKSGPLGAAIWAIWVWLSRFLNEKLYYRVMQDHVQTLHADNLPAVTHSTCSVFCATVRKMPLGYPLFNKLPKGGNAKIGAKDAQFQCVSFTFPAKDAFFELPAVMVRTLMERQDAPSKGKMTFCCQSLVIEASAPMDYTLDGELYVSRGNKLAIGMGPEIEFLQI
jgi:diacylglycerol kinase family enzyme